MGKIERRDKRQEIKERVAKREARGVRMNDQREMREERREWREEGLEIRGEKRLKRDDK